MSMACGCNLDDTNVSEKGVERAAPVQIKIQQAQDLIKQMNEKLSVTSGNFERKQIARDRNQEQLSSLRREESWYHYQLYLVRRRGFETIHHSSDGEQDELIRDLRYKLLHKTNCLAEEKKLIRQIRDIGEALVADPKPKIRCTYYAKETNAAQVCLAKLQKKKYQKKILEDLELARKKKMRSLQEIQIRVNEKRSRVHKMICDLVKQQEQVPDARNAANAVSTTSIQLE